ncbi:MAG: TIGR04141 family sporadically distributed protein, partial [Clostridia bacterium]|nr:TIGR04141 family sporadically distributed protein [Clostridia bacterium]
EEILKYIAEATRLYKTGRPVYRLGYALVIMLFTGIRQGEALALRWTDVDFENKVVNISRNFIITKNREKLSDADTNYIMIEKNRPKTISSIRKIPLNDKALNALTEIKKINGEHAHILSTKVGTVINPRNLYRMHENVCKKCNIKGCGLHSLRHMFSQGKVSAQCFVDDEMFRKQVLEIANEKFDTQVFDYKIKPLSQEFEVVYGIIDSKTGSLNERLPFFSLVNLMLTAIELERMHFKYSVCIIKRLG